MTRPDFVRVLLSLLPYSPEILLSQIKPPSFVFKIKILYLFNFFVGYRGHEVVVETWPNCYFFSLESN
ncbi:unnamed protein product [Brassica napus]|uniref:(rape) hypothetical protein n=1 Tax=Brassica napus TaxID=3708 RepID=A0A816MUD9_BRANA|nr:unnamed protein product [Brassica napus]